MKLVIQRLCRVAAVVHDLMTHRSLGKLYVDLTMPAPTLETIKLIKVERGWSWRGEYNISSEDAFALEVLMYNLEGTPRIVQINRNGEVKYIYPKGETRFCVY